MKEETKHNTVAFRVALPFICGTLMLIGTSRVVSAQTATPTPTPAWTHNGANISNTNSGNVGIGTANPTNTLSLRAVVPRIGFESTAPGAINWMIGADNSPAGFFLAYDVTKQSSRLFVSNAGHVGVGTVSPTSLLHVAGQADNLFNVSSTSSAGTDTVANFGSAAGSIMMLRANGNVGIGTNSPGYRLDVDGEINARGVKINGVPISAGAESSQWKTNGTSISSTNAGYVGIGTSTPATKLHVGGQPDNVFMVSSTGSAAGDTVAHFASAVGGIMTVRANGNVGVGTASPNTKLDVNGNMNVSGSITGGTIEARYQDVAEWVPSTQKLQAGTVVVLDVDKNNHVLASTSAYDSKVAGVVSVKPGVILGEGGEGKLMVATTGRVKVKVDATRAPIRVGDLLVTSEVAGVAMKSLPVDLAGTAIHRPGTIIGKALEPLEKGVGEILVLLSLQ